ncbi:hypothetical protein HU200_053443 [Digitaria exilis]|uniref:Uncharacterized protein n=1 Tax=Digitaria exilis TaxID=1010633 RepID=A0A835AKB8_9POAL|nr:hypothetical protein HU200_053443 [Digitaria exilis]CAB3460075.1 unnamed protein product [Digitaria exilis]
MDHQQMDMEEMEKKDASSALERSLSTVTYWSVLSPLLLISAAAPTADKQCARRTWVVGSCGACGYDLRLRSSDRNTAWIVGGGYGRAARRGVVAFDAIDDARFGHADEFRCVDVRARRLFVRRTRLLCRKCGASVGFGYDDHAGAARSPRYDIKIRALQPLAADDDASSPPAKAMDS